MDKRDVDKTAFATYHELFEITKTPFELRNALATFHKATNVISSFLKRRFAIVYIEDTVIFSRLPEQPLSHTEEVVRLLMDARMALKLKNCHFLCKFINYLGLLTAPGQLQGARKTTEVIFALWYPTTVSLMRIFLGFSNFYKRFATEFVKIAALLKMRLKKVALLRFELNGTERELIDKLKRC